MKVFKLYVDKDGVYRGPKVWRQTRKVTWDESSVDLVSLGTLEKFTGTLSLRCCHKLKDLGNLREVTNNLLLEGNSLLSSLGCLEEVGGDLLIALCDNVRDLGNLCRVGKNLNINFSPLLKNYGALETIGNTLAADIFPPISLSFRKFFYFGATPKRSHPSAGHWLSEFISYSEYSYFLNCFLTASLSKLPLLRSKFPICFQPMINAKLKGSKEWEKFSQSLLYEKG